MQNKFFKLWQLNKDKYTCFGLILLGVILFLTLGVYCMTEAKMNFAQADNLRKRLQLVRTFSIQYRDYDGHRVILQKELIALQNIFLPKSEFEFLANDLHNFAALHNIELKSLNFSGGGKDKEQQVAVYTAQIQAMGECQLVLDFMKDVERAENLMVFDKVVLTEDEGDRICLNADIVLFVKER